MVESRHQAAKKDVVAILVQSLAGRLGRLEKCFDGPFKFLSN